MKIFKFSFAFLIGICLASVTTVQAQPNKKITPALNNFLNTEFMVKFHDLGIEAEGAAKNIQENQGEFSNKDLSKLRTYYDQTAQRANKILVGIQTDFLDKKKLKMITEFPDMYSDGLQSKMRDLSDFYSKNFQQTLADAQVFEEDGSAILLLITEVIGLTKGLSKYMKDIKREARHYNEDYLRKTFIVPYSWKYWDELAGGTSRYNASQEPERFERKNRDQEFDNINSRLHRVGGRVQDARGKRPSNNNGNNNSSSGTDDSWSDDNWSNENSNSSGSNTNDDWGTEDTNSTDDWGTQDTNTTDDWGTEDTNTTDDWGTQDTNTTDDWGTDDTTTDDTNTGTDDGWDDWGNDGSSNGETDKKGTIKRDDNPDDAENPFIFEEWNEGDPKKKEDKPKSDVVGKKKTKDKDGGGN